MVKNLNIDVSEPVVRKILKDTALYQAHFPRRKNLFTRHLYLRGVGIEGLAGKSFCLYFSQKITKPLF